MIDFSIFKEVSIRVKNLGLTLIKNLRVNYSSNKRQYSAEVMNNLELANPQFIKIEKMYNISNKEAKELLLETLDEKSKIENTPLVSSESNKIDRQPSSKKENKANQFLIECLEKHKKYPTFFLDKEGLFFIYKERLGIDFSKEEISFLLKSSLKNDFPYWFWSFFYREKFRNMIPLFTSAFEVDNLKIKINVIRGLSKFSDTAETIFELVKREENELVIGTAIVELHKNKETDLIQRVITNAITRKLIPDVTVNEIRGIRIQLGLVEKKFLYQVIKTGWAKEKNKSLNILSTSADKSDLTMVEELIKKEKYRETYISSLNCLSSVGFSTETSLLEKELDGVRLEEYFLQVLDTLTSINDKNILPIIFEWLKGSKSFVGRFDSGLWKINDKLEKSIISLCDEEFYEVIVKDILSQPKDENNHLWVWRQFKLLELIDKPEIIEKIRKETRLNAFKEWKDVLEKIEIREAIKNKNKELLLKVCREGNYTMKMLALRELWKITNQEEAINFNYLIEQLRSDLQERLSLITTSKCSEKIKELAKNELDYFLGENRVFYLMGNKKEIYKNYKQNETLDERDKIFYELEEDISKFERIEEEYVLSILEHRNSISYNFIKTYIGRPFGKVYDYITSDCLTEKEKSILEDMIKNNKNSLLKLIAIKGAYHGKFLDTNWLREKVLEMASKFKEELLVEDKEKEDWFVNHILYGNSMNALAIMGNINDLSLIEEAINRDINTIIGRVFYYYSYFHNNLAFGKLISLIDILEKEDEIENARETLDTLDYNWTKEVLKIKD